ncbi:MAG: hypothetical protein OXC71_02090 [Chloroflexi bacterium]|nr:hypothetical protein [Chloroflexota bacterium]
MYMALRPAGGDEAAISEWSLTRRLFDTGNRHSAVIDETWSESGGRGGGAQQLAVQAVFSLLAGDSLPAVLEWLEASPSVPEERLLPGSLSLLRETPMCHMNPFRVDLDAAGRVGVSEPAEKAIGLELIEAVRPRVLICDGNSDGEPWSSPWAFAHSTSPESSVVSRTARPRTFLYKETQLQSGPLAGMTVIGLPTLARVRGHGLAVLLGLINERITEIHDAAR